MKRAGRAGGGAAWAGGGGAAGNLERPLKPKEWFFLINSKCHFSRQPHPRPRWPLLFSVCLAVVVTMEITDETDETVAAECVCAQPFGGWVLSRRQHACGDCSLPLTSRQRCIYAVEKIEISQHQKKCSTAAVGSKNVLYCLCPQIRVWRLIILL